LKNIYFKTNIRKMLINNKQRNEGDYKQNIIIHLKLILSLAALSLTSRYFILNHQRSKSG
jgi:hypothetical protein